MVSWVRGWSLSRQLSSGAFVLIVLVMGLFLLVTGNQARTLMLDSVTQGQRNQLTALAAQLNTTHANILKNTEMLASVFRELYSSRLQFDPTRTVRVGSFDSPRVTHQGEQVNLNFDKVDQFARMTGGNATVFIRYQDDFLRVTTSLKNQQGQRAIGTLLGKSHPGYRQLMAGKPYVGEAHLFGTDYMTKYSPVIGADGQVSAILYVGLPISSVMKELRDNLLALNVGQSGYLGLLHRGEGKAQGKLIVHPSAQGKVFQNEYSLALQGRGPELLNQQSGELDLQLEGRHARMLFHTTGSGEWAIFSVSYFDEFVGPVNTLLGEMSLMSLLASLILAAALGVFLRRSLKPVGKMRDLMKQIGQGDLTLRFKAEGGEESRNELDQLKRSINRMLDQFATIIVKVRNTGEEIAVTSEQVASTSNVMQGVAHSSRDETTQVSAAISQMAESVESVAANAVAVFEDTSVTAELSANGSEVMVRMVTVIEELQQQFSQAADGISQLEKDSAEIGQVVEVISSVADQTNLLALNAAIEAARAGEQGRGFAVVADEVRTLALRTQQATQEIQDVVSKLQSNSSLAAEQMVQGVNQVQRCVGQVGEAGQVLVQIREAADMVRGRMERVAQETEEQSAAALQIRENGVSLEGSAAKTASEAEENAMAGKMIAEHASRLREQVSRFSVPSGVA